jgi:hypothetical protein
MSDVERRAGTAGVASTTEISDLDFLEHSYILPGDCQKGQKLTNPDQGRQSTANFHCDYVCNSTPHFYIVFAVDGSAKEVPWPHSPQTYYFPPAENIGGYIAKGERH